MKIAALLVLGPIGLLELLIRMLIPLVLIASIIGIVIVAELIDGGELEKLLTPPAWVIMKTFCPN